MKIYDWPTGPYPARVRIALAEKNLQSRVQFVTVNLWKGEHKKPDFLAKNYSGTLPVLELDDGTLLPSARPSPNTSTRLMALPRSPAGRRAKRA